jgi:hypothetical protein
MGALSVERLETMDKGRKRAAVAAAAGEATGRA